MIGVEPVIDLVESLIWSGQVEGERPLSGILVAPPGAGKTTILELVQCNTAKFFADFTSREVKGALQQEQQRQNLTHFLIGDFLSVFGHQKSTVKLTINLIARLTGETMTHMPWSGEQIAPIRMGVITGIPPEDLKRRDIRAHVRTGGFASRFLMARYDYSQATIDRVHKYIRDDKYTKEKPFIFNVRPGALKIDIPKSISTRVSELSNRVKKDPIGFRAHFHLRALIRAIARQDGRNVVREKDYQRLLTYCEFFTERGRVI